MSTDWQAAAKALMERILRANKAADSASESNLYRGSMGSWRRAEAGSSPEMQAQQNRQAMQVQDSQGQMNMVGQMMGQQKAEDQGSDAHKRAMAQMGFGMGIRPRKATLFQNQRTRT